MPAELVDEVVSNQKVDCDLALGLRLAPNASSEHLAGLRPVDVGWAAQEGRRVQAVAVLEAPNSPEGTLEEYSVLLEVVAPA